MLAAKRFAYLNPIHTTNFLPDIHVENCTGCDKCIEACPVEAMSLISANDPHKPKRKIARLEAELCLGCGICVRNCSKNALSLKQRKERVITPLNSAHKAVIMAIERGHLQDLIFDNQVLFSHRALAAVFGIILKLPPLKQTLASQQVKSRYLENVIKKFAN
jgi:ferredoxin